MKKITPLSLVKLAAVAAIYVVLTVVIAPLSYGPIQLRFSEILVLLCFYKKDYAYPLVLGCLIANFFSPMMAFDLPFGTLGTIVAVIGVIYCKRLWIAALCPVIANGLIVGFELWLAFTVDSVKYSFLGDSPIWFFMLTVAAGEFIVVAILGIPVFKLLEKNKHFMRLITE